MSVRYTRALLYAPLLLGFTVPPAAALDPAIALADEAVANNPDLSALHARTLELSALADVSNAWSDPIFSVEYLNVPVDTFSIQDSPMSGVQFTLRQRLPEWGWTRASKEVAEHGVERNRYGAEEAALRLRHGVERLYWQLALSRQLERITRRHVDRTVELERAMRARYEVGRSGQNAVLRLEVLRDRLSDDLGDFDRAEREISAGLARALARPAVSAFETPEQVRVAHPSGAAPRWLELAKQARPSLAAMREAIEQEQKAASLARIEARPDVDVWIKYRLRRVDTPLDDGTDFFSAGISIPIPLGSRKRSLGRERASLAAADGARARLAGEVDRIAAELVGVEAEWRRAADKAARYEKRLLPAARAALETTLSDFTVGRAEFSSLYDAQVDLLDLERAHLTAVIETRLQDAAARAATGQRTLGGPS